MLKTVLIIIAVIPVILLALSLAAARFQEKMIFLPQQLPASHKFIFKTPFEEMNFETEDKIIINALLFKSDSLKPPLGGQRGASKGLILYFHGNAGCLESWGFVANDFLPHHYDVLIMDYRGFGKSKGIISNEKQLHRDAELIYFAMLEKYEKEKIIFYGRSIGTGIASRLASVHKSKMLILETPYYNFPDLVKKIYPFLPVSLILKYKLKNNVYLPKVKCPVYLIHGTNDEIVPYNSSVRLARHSERIKLITIEHGTHNNLSDFPLYHQTISEILFF